jgi:hypothetical protein
MGDTDKTLITPDEEFNSLKRELEIKKIQKEIEQLDNTNNDLTKKWYKKPQWIMALSPLFVGLLTLSIAWASGFLQAQSNLNKIQEENFIKRRDSINNTITILKSEKDSLTAETFILRIKNIAIDSANKVLNDKFNEILNSLTLLNDSTQTLNTKNKYFSDKFINIQKENIKLKSDLSKYTIQEKCKILEKKLALSMLEMGYENLRYRNMKEPLLLPSDEEIEKYISTRRLNNTVGKDTIK